MPARTYVYVDGFNFYYGAVRKTVYRWLDLWKLFRSLLPGYDIQSVKYFTAAVAPLPHDPHAPNRQKIYWKALQAHPPGVHIIKGQFRLREKTGVIVRGGRTPQGATHGSVVTIESPEEKGSDVNLAVHLVNDAWLDQYDCAVVVSNDGDLVEALRIVKVERSKEVVLFTPPRYKNRRLRSLKRNATWCKSIKQGDLAAAQLPSPIPGTAIAKPSSW